MVQFPMILSDR